MHLIMDKYCKSNVQSKGQGATGACDLDAGHHVYEMLKCKISNAIFNFWFCSSTLLCEISWAVMCAKTMWERVSVFNPLVGVENILKACIEVLSE